MWIVVAIVLLVAAAMGYVRLAPVDPGAWYQLPAVDGVGDVQTGRSFTAVRTVQTTPEGVLRAFETAALATPRTRLIGGSVAKERLVLETRSALWGFPDYTTVGFQDGLLVVHGRAKFGASDLGVNRARIEGWLAQLGPLVVTPS